MELLLSVTEVQGLQSHCGGPAGLRSPSGLRTHRAGSSLGSGSVPVLQS